MDRILTNVDPWVTTMLLTLAMLAAWRVGCWRGRRLTTDADPSSKSSDAVTALLGLLLAFTFSMSLAKHEGRRQMVVTDANSIGDFYTCASLLKSPIRERLQGVIRKYVEHRLEAMRIPPANDREMEASLAEFVTQQGRMQTLVGEALEQGTPVAVPIVNTLNEVTSSHAARLAAAHDRLPPSIVILLFLTAVISVWLSGQEQGLANGKRLAPTLGFIALVCLTVLITLDLNQPRRGMITVSQEPIERVLQGMQP